MKTILQTVLKASGSHIGCRRSKETMAPLNHKSIFINLFLMPYLIDANNLAGKLDLLEDKNFDHELAEMIADFLYYKNCKIILVFDGHGKLNYDYNVNLKIIYSGESHPESSADDEIIYLVKNSKAPQDYIVVSDDNDIKEAIRVMNRDKGMKIKIVSATSFAKQIMRALEEDGEADNGDGLDDANIRKINEELMRRWVEKD